MDFLPDPSRPIVTTGEAARILGCTIDTVKNRIKRNVFNDGAGRLPDGRWWIYKDLVVSDDTRELEKENAALRRQLKEVSADLAAERSRWADERAVLEARHRSDRSRIQTVLAINAATLSAGESYKAAADETVTALSKYKTAADEWSQVSAMWRDLMAQENVPDDPREIGNGP